MFTEAWRSTAWLSGAVQARHEEGESAPLLLTQGTWIRLPSLGPSRTQQPIMPSERTPFVLKENRGMLLLLRSHLNQGEQGNLKILVLEGTLDHLIHTHHITGRETDT